MLEKVLQQGKPIVIICEEVEGEALATLVINKLRGTFKCCAVKAPGYGDRRKAMLEDIAVLTGGRAIFEDLGIQLENVQLKDLGKCKKVKIDKDNTVIIEGAGKKADISGRRGPDPARAGEIDQRLRQGKAVANASPSCRAAWPRSTSGPRPKAR